jgi:hypothetical protein
LDESSRTLSFARPKTELGIEPSNKLLLLKSRVSKREEDTFGNSGICPPNLLLESCIFCSDGIANKDEGMLPLNALYPKSTWVRLRRPSQ